MQTAVFVSVLAGHPADLSFFASGSKHLRAGKPIHAAGPTPPNQLHRTEVRRAESRRPLPGPVHSPRPLSVAQKG